MIVLWLYRYYFPAKKTLFIGLLQNNMHNPLGKKILERDVRSNAEERKSIVD